MVWIILIAVAVVVIALAWLAWWSSGRARPLGRAPGMTRTERHYDANRQAGSGGPGSL